MMRIEGRRSRRHGLWVWLVGVACAVSGSVSYGQSLEELEQQLKKEQAAEQRRQAAEQQRKAAEAKRQASMGTLVLRSDAACELSIDGTSKGALEAGRAREAAGAYAAVFQEAGARLDQLVEELVAAYGDFAKRAMAANQLSDAQTAINRAKALRALKVPGP